MKRRLMRASEWAKVTFTPDSMPTKKTIMKWIIEGKIDGVITENCAYVYEGSTPAGRGFQPPKPDEDYRQVPASTISRILRKHGVAQILPFQNQ